MKSERRQELKSSIPPEGLEGLADYWREYGNKVLLFVIVALIAFMAVRYWNEKKQQDAVQINSALDSVRSNLGEIEQLQMAEASGQAGAVEARQRATSAANDAISTLLSTSKDPKIIARAYLSQGELDWRLANMTDPPGAATRPELKISNRDGLLSAASEAYAKVLDAPYSSDALNVFSARMGLAAIAENQGKWDEAKKQYQAITDASSFPKSFKELASSRIKELPNLQNAPVLNPPVEPTPASTAPAVMGPEAPLLPNTTTVPATMTAPQMTTPAGPTTLPAIPATGPASAPASTRP
jgi:tetratricopeptide repeat protein